MATSGSKSVTVTSWDTLKFSWELKSQSVANNTSSVSWKLELIATSSGRISSTASKDWSVTVNGTKYSGTNTIGISNNSTKTLASGTTTISHNTDGTKTFSYSFSQEFAITFSGSSIGTKSGSGSGTLTTIPRKSTLSVSNGTLGTAQTLTINRNSSSFTHTIKYTCGSASGTIATKTSSTSISFTPPLSLASQNTIGTSVSVKFEIITYSGSTNIGSNTKTITCSMPASIRPSVSLAVGDATGLPSYIKGKSKFKVQVTTSISYSSPIASLVVVANGTSYFSTSFTTSVIVNSGVNTIKANVVDERGREASTTINIVVYDPPTFTTVDGELGKSQLLGITSQNTAFKHTITYTCGNKSGTICEKTSNTNVYFTPDISLASQNTTGTTVPIKYTMISYAGDNNNGYHEIGSSSKTVNCFIPASVSPTVTINTEDTSGAFAKYGSFVKSISNLKVDLLATESYGSPIASYITTISSRKYTSDSFDAGLITSTNDITITATVTDERGRTGTATYKVSDILQYYPPAISKLTVGRCNEDGIEDDKGEFARVSYSASATALSMLNTAKFTLQYKKTTETEWLTGETTTSNNVFAVDKDFIFPAETGSSYDVIIIAEDSHATTTRTTSVSTGFTLMHWGDDGRSMGIGKVAELEDVLDIGFQTRFYGGVICMKIDAGTDLDSVLTPNIYVSSVNAGDGTDVNYPNCPINSNASFYLEVQEMGIQGQRKQKFTVCDKIGSRIFERFYYQNAWGKWICVCDYKNTLLWSGAENMEADKTIEFINGETVSRQQTGIVLVFSYYDLENSIARNYDFHSFFVPKYMVANHSNAGQNFIMSRPSFGRVATKYLNIYNDSISGTSFNNASGTSNGITFNNTNFVLRYVIGV